MRKLILFTVALLCAASMWAADPQTEGPWTLADVRFGTCAREANMSISFNNLDNSHWGTLNFWNDGDGIGWTVNGSSSNNSKNGVFSIFYHEEPVPSYTCKRLTWKFKVGTKGKKHYGNTCLYARDNVEDLKGMNVDFTEEYNDQTGAGYILGRLHNDDYDRQFTSEITKTFDFDNRNGSSLATKSWYLLMTHVVSSKDSKSDLHEWGTFLNQSASWTTLYYKYITYDANGGTGSMANQTIENSGTLTANSFTRTGHNFTGWATSSDGEVVYADKAAITVTETDKGPVTLYAVWTPSVAVVESLINEIGTVYYAAESKAKIDAARAAYDALSAGDKASVSNYGTLTNAEAAYASMQAVAEVKTKIDAIGVVTTESGDAITAAHTAYMALSAEQKALMTATDLTTLLNAEDAYGVLTGKSTVQFKDNNDALIRSQVIALDYPDAPLVEGYTFQYWQLIGEDLTAGIIRLQAVYKSNTPTDVDETIVNAQSSNRKFIKDGNLYILKDEFIYTINGQKVK